MDELVGRTCWELIHGTSEPIEGCPFERMRKSANPVDLVYNLYL
jgi:hypothetical protein